MVSNLVKSRIGVNVVSQTVEVKWECGWQEYAAQNDDAIDGVIFMRRGSERPYDTGGLVFVQIKCGGEGYRRDQKQHPDHIGVSLGRKYIEKHLPRWKRMPGPVVLIFVDDTISAYAPPAWWVDLKAITSYSKTNKGLILIPKNQRFAHHTKGPFHKLCGSGPSDRMLEQVEVDRSGVLVPKLGKNESLRADAWDFYKEWRDQLSSRVNPVVGEVLVNRVGWKHATRKGRLPERILQSWLLFGVAKAMVRTCKDIYTLGHARTQTYSDGNIQVIDYLGLRARVVFPHRHPSVIQVVLRRSRLISPASPAVGRQKIWFYSVYELRRGSALR